MAYCLKCGAYIPEGQSVCLACGYDPAEEQKEAEVTRGGSAAQYKKRTNESNAELRQRLEEQRRRTQEQSRQWAEQEKQRREEQAAREEVRRRQQEEDRRWAQEEYERRQAEERTRAASRPDLSYRSSGGTAAEGNKALAALSYLSVLFAIPYIFTPEDRFAKFHAKQGLKLFIFGILADMLGALTGFGWIVTLLRLYMIYKGMSNALNGKWEPLPWIGTLGE